MVTATQKGRDGGQRPNDALARLRSGRETRALRLLALGVALSLSACASAGPDLRPDDPAYKDPARRAYYDGMRNLIEGDYLKAAQLFQAVAASPRHVKHAALAKLRLGDAYFFQSRYAEAAEIFRGFVLQHNSDPNLPYARFKVAECQFKRIPGEWFASPPAHEFDQTLTLQAEAELKGFLALFPTSVYAAQAQAMLTTVRSMLLRHELYAANFYAGLEQWQAVAWRLRHVIDIYPELAVREDLVWRLAEAWREVGDKAETAKALNLYVARFPGGGRHELAQRRLEELARELEPKPAPKAPTPAPATPTPGVDGDDDDDDEVDDDGDTPTDDDRPRLRPLELPKLDPGIED